MAELITLSFPTEGGAERCLGALLPLQHEHLIKLTDVAWGSKDKEGQIRLSHMRPTPFEALMRGSLWGTLAGAIALEPFFGMLVGGTTELLIQTLSPNSNVISRKHIEETLKKKIEPGQSAAFLMVSKATPDKVLARVHDHDATVISTSLSATQEKELREAWQRVKAQGPLALQGRRTGSETRPL